MQTLVLRLSAAGALILALYGCHVRPRRFANLAVVPAPQVAIPPERLNSSADASQINQALATRFSQAVEYQKRFGGFQSANLFCSSGCDSVEFLSVTALATPAGAAAPEVQNSLFLRSAERAQAEFVRQSFAKLPTTMSAAEAITTLSKQLGAQEKTAKDASPFQPRVQLTLSHLLTLPGEWERLQYLAVFFVLHSGDVRFVDTNEFESVFRDIDLGKLTQTAVDSVTAKGSLGSLSVTPTLSYTEALERQLKEQLQFRASSIDFNGRVFAIVLKSSQTNKLPTLIRQIVTLQYENNVTGRRRMLSPAYKAGEFANFQWSDQVVRIPSLLAPDDADTRDPASFRTQATPIYVGVVRRVKNARGVNTSLEDDDDVQYVTQAKVLPAITLDRTPKCEYSVHAALAGNSLAEVRILAPGDAEGRYVVFASFEDAQRFITALRQRIAAVPPAVQMDGLVWDAKVADLQGSRIVWRPNDATAPDNQDWTRIDPGTLRPVEYCPPAK